MRECCAILPAYNEDARIAEVAAAALAAGFDVIAVDDGSTDKTFERLAFIDGVVRVRHCLNRGQGAALKTGSLLARELGYEYIAHLDADGQHRLTDLQTLIEFLKNSDAEIVIGSRFLGLTSAMPWTKKITLSLARIFSQHVLQLPFSDPQNGLRVFRTSSLDKIIWHKDNYEHCTEILSAVIANKVKFLEAPIIVNYDAYATAKTRRPSWRMGWKLMLNKLFDKI